MIFAFGFMPSHVNPLRSFFNLFQAEECTLAGTGADFADFLPGRFIRKMGIPEWPCATLNGPRLIDGTLAIFGIEECAISVRKLCE